MIQTIHIGQEGKRYKGPYQLSGQFPIVYSNNKPHLGDMCFSEPS